MESCFKAKQIKRENRKRKDRTWNLLRFFVVSVEVKAQSNLVYNIIFPFWTHCLDQFAILLVLFEWFYIFNGVNISFLMLVALQFNSIVI